MRDRDTPHQKSVKSNFDLIYDREDPREYLNSPGGFDYCVPRHGQRVFHKLVGALREEKGRDGADPRKLSVVDVCCSSGINAALLEHDLTLDDLYARYGSPRRSRTSPARTWSRPMPRSTGSAG